MNKSNSQKVRYCIQWETHPKNTVRGLCSLMEHQSLVDIAICCGNNTLHAHKCILAASSPLFKEAFEKNSAIEQVVVSGCDFQVMKSIVEIIYCGETTISEDYIKYLVAAAKLFQIKSLQNLFSTKNECSFQGDEIFLPVPQFLTKKPKYPTAFNPLNNTSSMSPIPPSNLSLNNLFKSNFNLEAFTGQPLLPQSQQPQQQRKYKRKYIRAEAEKACAKEAQASRMALANLQKEIANTPQVNSFIIEDTCTETTVENFIPHSEAGTAGPSPDKLSDLQQIQVLNYPEIDGGVFVPQTQFLGEAKPNLVQFTLQNSSHGAGSLSGLTADKIKDILGNDLPANVEIMFKTSEGNIVSVTDEVLQSISKGGLQYQVVDENGHVGEVRELQMLDNGGKVNKRAIDKMAEEKTAKMPKMMTNEYTNYLSNFNSLDINEAAFSESILINDTDDKVDFVEHVLKGDSAEKCNEGKKEVEKEKFSPDIFFANVPDDSCHNDKEDEIVNLDPESPKSATEKE